MRPSCIAPFVPVAKLPVIAFAAVVARVGAVIIAAVTVDIVAVIALFRRVGPRIDKLVAADALLAGS